MQQNFTSDALYHSETLPAFSEHNAQWKFEPAASHLSLPNAWWLANLSHLAYYDEEDAKPALQKIGLTLEAFIDDRKENDSHGKLIKDTQAYIVSTNDTVFMAFRGTEPDRFKDVLADAYLHPTEFPGKGMVHSGFFGALSGDCWQHILSVLDRPDIKAKTLWITGHSLGAALASIAAAHINPTGVYTFASPRVGDSKFCASFKGTNNQRFANCSDLVTQIPVKNILGYQHINSLQYFNAKGNLYTNPSKEFIESDRFKARMLYPVTEFPIPFFTKKVHFRALADHSISNYLYAIWKALQP